MADQIYSFGTAEKGDVYLVSACVIHSLAGVGEGFDIMA